MYAPRVRILPPPPPTSKDKVANLFFESDSRIEYSTRKEVYIFLPSGRGSIKLCNCPLYEWVLKWLKRCGCNPHIRQFESDPTLHMLIVVQLVEILDCDSRCYGFESHLSTQYRGLGLIGKLPDSKSGVEGSNPSAPAKNLTF